MTPETYTLILQLLPQATLDTIYMVVAATCFALLIGFPLGVILTITAKGHIKEQPMVYKSLSAVVNIGRSFPFAILLVAIIPLTRFIVGTSLGTTAAIVPLAIACAPFVARLVESALNEVSKEIIEASIVIGSSPWQIISKVMVPESLPSLIQALTLTVINLIGYSAMAGMVGGGGLGKVAIQYGYMRFEPMIMLVTVAVMIILVQGTQSLGNFFSMRITKRRGIRVHD
jgi:D-methionine transport system permease protein